MLDQKDQVTLKDFLTFIFRFIQLVVSLFMEVRRLIITHMVYVLLFMGVLGGIGYFTGKDGKKEYEAGITCVYNELHKKSYGEMILLLNSYVTGNETGNIVSALRIDEKIAASITHIQALNIVGSPLHEDMSMEKLPFYIRYTTSDPSSYQIINMSLIKYLQDCDYNLARRKIRIDNAQERIAYLNHQLASLDSLKAGYTGYFEKGRTSNSEPADIKAENLYKESEALFTGKQDQQWTLHFDNSVEIVYQQLPVIKFTPATHMRNALLGALAGFILAMCFVFVKDFKRSSE